MLILDMPPPVILTREALSALLGIRAPILGAVVLARLHMLVVDVPVEMRLGAEALPAAVERALVRTLVVPLVVAGEGVSVTSID